jgi:hypothetical protein
VKKCEEIDSDYDPPKRTVKKEKLIAKKCEAINTDSDYDPPKRAVKNQNQL